MTLSDVGAIVAAGVFGFGLGLGLMLGAGIVAWLRRISDEG